MDPHTLERLYERASMAADSLDHQLPWLEAQDTDVDSEGHCQNEFTIRLVVSGATEGQQIDSLSARLQECLADLGRLASASAEQQSRRLAPSARQRGGSDIRKFG